MTTSRRKITKGLGAIGVLALIGAGIVAGAGWTTPAATKTGVEYGEAVPMGNGTARVYIELHDGVPVELGVALSENAMEGLPTHHTPGGIEGEPGHMMFFSTPAMPAVNPTPYRHVFLGWNPGGHQPPGVYDIAHFDFHFYTTSNEARVAIDPATDPQFDARAANHPAAERMPAGYMAIPGGVPLMGTHWVDPATPELNGVRFTETFIFGSWDGEPTFVEPMITREFLLTKPAHFERVPLPARADKAGWQPSAYRVYFDDATREYRVALTEFVWREASGS